LALFDWNSAASRPAAEEIIIEAALDAMKDANPLVCLVGHADASGSPKLNLILSERRANAVKAELLKLGLNTAQVKVSFKGSDDLVVSSANRSREMLNRSVEIFIDHGSASIHCK
jgi:outer membrane protein OmpA-like peptidoglycan-associated protein